MCETIGMQPEPKKPRILYEEEQDKRHSDLLVHSLLNFSDNFNMDPSFRLHKHPYNSLTFNLKLAPIHTVTDGLPPYPSSQDYQDSQKHEISLVKRQDTRISKTEKQIDQISDPHTSASLALADLPYSHSLQVVTQPVNYQIANYNIHPPPALAVDRAITTNITIHAQLVENDKRTIVDGGFQSGDVRVLRAGHTTLYFTGLKLNKMGPIKTELHFRDYKRIPTNFCIQFKIGNRTIFSEPFKLVSSCAQLPQEVRDIVRPSKKTSRSNSPEPHHDSTPSPKSSPLPKDPFSAQDENETMLRTALENAIEGADGETAAIVAKKLALLRKRQ